MESNYGVIIRNLKNINDLDLKKKIAKLFTDYLRIVITTENIEIVEEGGWKSAHVDLICEADVKHVLQKLKSRDNRIKTGFQFLEIAAPRVLIDVDRRIIPQQEKVSSEKSSVVIDDSEESLPTKSVEYPRYFIYGDRLQTESKREVFRRGGGNHLNDTEDFTKTICNFVSSLEDGKLFIGVNEDGCIIGFPCNHNREWKIRKSIDHNISAKLPHINPQNYSVEFVPVCDWDGTVKGNDKVLEIKVKLTLVNSKVYGGVDKQQTGSFQSHLKSPEISKQVHHPNVATLTSKQKGTGNKTNKPTKLSPTATRHRVDMLRPREKAASPQTLRSYKTVSTNG